MVKMVVIAAMDKNFAIGKGNEIPWYLPEDLKRFKQTTMGHPMIMGSTTWKSFGGKALPGRTSIVLTSKPDSIEIREQDVDRVVVVTTLEDAIEKAKELALQHGMDQYFVIGGANIYSQVVDIADVFDLTTVEIEVDEPDTFFPLQEVEARLQREPFVFDEYESTIGYSVVADDGTKFSIKRVIRQ